MKIGVFAALIIGVFVVNPEIHFLRFDPLSRGQCFLSGHSFQ
jgi:hypothetical protein